jgi:hypothetical protein
MKKWTQRELRQGGVVEPSAINDELRAQQSSMTTLDREQYDKDWVEPTYVADYALHRVWVDPRYPSGDYGEQDTQASDGEVPVNSFLGITAELDPGGWFDLASAAGTITLPGFKGGNLLVEWSGNCYVLPNFSDTQNQEFPQNPKYVNFRILVNNTLLTERRGTGYHEHFRVFGSRNFPPGDLEVRLQAKVTSVGPDDVIETTTPRDIPMVHIYSNKYFIIGRFR